jgi:hypothetical protein
MPVPEMPLQMSLPPHNVAVANPSPESSLASLLLVMRIYNPFFHSRTLLLEIRLIGILAGIDLIRSFNELHCKTTLDVPDDMTVHEPCTWVVGLEADHGVSERCTLAATLKHDGVTAQRVVEVQSGGVREGAKPGTEDGHVMTVKMHGVRWEELVGDDEVDPFILLSQHSSVGDQSTLIGAGSRGTKVVGLVSESLQCRLGVIDVDDGVVDEPLEDEMVRRDLGTSEATGRHVRNGRLKFSLVAGGLLQVRNKLGKGLVRAGGEGGGGLVAKVGDGEFVFGSLVLDDTVRDSEACVHATRVVSIVEGENMRLTYVLGQAVWVTARMK